MNLYKFRTALTVLVLSTCLLVLACIATLPDTVAANGEPWKTSIQIPIVVNDYNNAITDVQLKNSIKEANKLLKQADMKLVVVKTNDPPGAGNGDNGDGEFTSNERDAMRTFGGKELKKLKNKRGIKLSFGQKPVSEKPNVQGVAKAPGGYPPKCKGKPGDPTIILKYAGDARTGKIIAHELGHVMGITGDYDNPDRIMDAQGKGNKYSKGEIKEMRKFRYKFGKCASQWKRAFPAIKDKEEFGATTDDASDQGNSVSAIYDLHQVYLTSAEGFTDIDAEITVAEPLLMDEEINATYSLGFDIDDNTETGVIYAGYDGIDRIVYVDATWNIDLEMFTVSGEVENTIAGTTDPLPEDPEAVTVNEICDFEEVSEPAGIGFFFKIPKALLSLSAAEAPVVATAGENGSIYDTATDFVFDSERWLKDPPFTTFGTGVPTPGENYPFEISGLTPNDAFDLYLDDTLMLSGTLDGYGSYSGNLIFPIDLPTTEWYFLTAQDSTGEFAYSFTCPGVPEVPAITPPSFLLALLSLLGLGAIAMRRMYKR